MPSVSRGTGKIQAFGALGRGMPRPASTRLAEANVRAAMARPRRRCPSKPRPDPTATSVDMTPNPAVRMWPLCIIIAAPDAQCLPVDALSSRANGESRPFGACRRAGGPARDDDMTIYPGGSVRAEESSLPTAPESKHIEGTRSSGLSMRRGAGLSPIITLPWAGGSGMLVMW